MQNEKLKIKKSGKIVIPLLVGLGIFAIVLGILVVSGERNGEGEFEWLGIGKESGLISSSEIENFKGPSVTVLPTQIIVVGQKFFLSVTTPIDGMTANQNKVTVVGRTVAGADVSINEKDLVAGTDGSFSGIVTLEEGENPILITAGNENGFEEKEITVYYEK